MFEKHQCDYCCWYYEPRGCECPFNMKESACERAKKEKHKQEWWIKRSKNENYV